MDPDVDRGTCPACGSGEVIHVVRGLVTPDVAAVPWVRPAGCVVDGNHDDRECGRCGTTRRSSDT